MLINPNNNANAYCFCQIATRFRWRWERDGQSGVVSACSREHARRLIISIVGEIRDDQFTMVAWSYNENLIGLPVECQVLLVMR